MVPEIELLTEFKEKKFVFAGTDSKNKAEFLIFHTNAHWIVVTGKKGA